MDRRLRSALIGLVAVILAVVFTHFVRPVLDQPLAPEEVPGDLDIFILAGQSNMSGRGSLDELPSGFPAGGEHIYVYSNDGRWRRAAEPLDHPAGQVDPVSRDDWAGVGPGLAMAEALVQLDPGRKIALVPCALGGSSIDQWRPATGRDTLYGSCLARAKEAARHGRIRAFVWYQGESDTGSLAAAEAWPAKFQALVRALRRDLGQPRLPVVYTQLATVGPELGGPPPGWNRLKQLQATLKIPLAVMVKSDDLKVFDGIHLDTASQMKLGRRYALALHRMLKDSRP